MSSMPPRVSTLPAPPSGPSLRLMLGLALAIVLILVCLIVAAAVLAPAQTNLKAANATANVAFANAGTQVAAGQTAAAATAYALGTNSAATNVAGATGAAATANSMSTTAAGNANAAATNAAGISGGATTSAGTAAAGATNSAGTAVAASTNGAETASAGQTAQAKPTGTANVITTTNVFTLSVSVASGSGSITSTPAGINCPGTCSKTFPTNSSVILTAIPSQPTFSGVAWTNCTPGANPLQCSVTLSGDMAVVADFTTPPTPTPTPTGTPVFGNLGVAILQGTGTITSWPAAINCPSGPCSASFPISTTITLTANPTSPYTQVIWGSGCNTIPTPVPQQCQVTLGGNTLINVSFVQAFPTLYVNLGPSGSGTITSLPGTINCPGTCSSSFARGTVVTLIANPNTSATPSPYTGVTWTNCTPGGNPLQCTVTLDADTYVSATFTQGAPPGYYQLNVSIGQGNGTIVSSPGGINCAPGSGTCSASFAVGTTVQLTAAPTAPYSFGSWTNCTPDLNNPLICTVDMTSNRSVTASFNSPTPTATATPTNTPTLTPTPTATETSFQLSVAIGGGSGTVISDPGGINCPSGACSALFTSGTVVTLTATATDPYTFGSWVNCPSGNSSPTCTLTMTSNKSVSVTFNPPPPTATATPTNTPVGTFLLSVGINSGSGSVLSSPGGINCPGACSASFTSGSNVTLTAVPNSPYTFGSWVNCPSGDRSNPCTVTMNSNVSIGVTFNPPPPTPTNTVTLTPTPTNTPVPTFQLNVSIGSGSGTIVSTPGGINCPSGCSASFTSGGTVILTAAPNLPDDSVNWTNCTVDPNNPFNCSVVMTTNRSVSATFFHSNTLTVNIVGPGSVTSKPAGINCSSGSCSAIFVSGTAVTLTENPDAGSRFSNWAGCDSTTGNKCNITLSTDKDVTATFIGPTPTDTPTNTPTATNTPVIIIPQ